MCWEKYWFLLLAGVVWSAVEVEMQNFFPSSASPDADITITKTEVKTEIKTEKIHDQVTLMKNSLVTTTTQNQDGVVTNSVQDASIVTHNGTTENGDDGGVVETAAVALEDGLARNEGTCFSLSLRAEGSLLGGTPAISSVPIHKKIYLIVSV